MPIATMKPNLLRRLNADFETAPVVEHGPNVFTSQDYRQAVSIRRSAAQERINELIRRKSVRRVLVKSPSGLHRAYEYLGKD